MRGPRVLVTGAGGFIGRWSVPPLIRAGFDVHAVLSGAKEKDARAKLADDPAELADSPAELTGATLYCADLLDESAIDQLLDRVQATHLLHFAWIASPGVYGTSAENFRWLASSQYLLRSFRARGGMRVMMAGSCAEYDWSQAAVCDEWRTPLADQASAPPSPYAASKIAMQRALADFGREQGISTAWGRIFLQYGPYEHPNRLVPSVIRNLLLNREAPCSHGRQIRSFLHAEDVGSAFAHVLAGELEGPVNIGTDEGTAIADVVGRIGRQIGRPDLLRLGALTSPPLEPPLLVPDTQRLREEARWRPRFSLDEGLRDTIAWWRRRLHDAEEGRG